MGFTNTLGGLAECGAKARASVFMTIDFVFFRHPYPSPKSAYETIIGQCTFVQHIG